MQPITDMFILLFSVENGQVIAMCIILKSNAELRIMIGGVTYWMPFPSPSIFFMGMTYKKGTIPSSVMFLICA